MTAIPYGYRMIIDIVSIFYRCFYNFGFVRGNAFILVNACDEYFPCFSANLNNFIISFLLFLFPLSVPTIDY